MNPEFQRNLWLNLSPGRLITMTVVLAAVFFAASVVPFAAGDIAVEGAARTFFWLIVVFWGTWLSARAVVGEIRDRTWDGQRMSAIPPWSMVWGKLFGSTIFVWYGGAICLGVLFLQTLGNEGLGAALRELAYFLVIGVFAHAVSMLTSLLAVRRQLRHAAFGVFLYQLFGILAALSVASAWPDTWSDVVDLPITWYGTQVMASTFVLASIAVYAAWAIVGNHRLMRQELQFTNSPLVWIAFLLFVMAYYAGFVDALGEAELGDGVDIVDWGPLVDPVVLRLFMAAVVAFFLSYVMLFLDSKDTVTLRWIGRNLMAGNLGGAAFRIPSWGWSILAAGILTVALIVLGSPVALDPEIVADLEGNIEGFYLPANGMFDWRALTAAAFFFLLRDAGIVLAYNASAQSRRADFAAFVTLFLLYAILPAIVLSIGPNHVGSLFAPTALEAAWLAVIPPAIEAGIVWMLVMGRMSRVRVAPA